MTRDDFHRLFHCPGPVVLPVIHVRDLPQTCENLRIVAEARAPGAFLINHDFGVPRFVELIRAVRVAVPEIWLGCNFLGLAAREAFPLLADLARSGTRIDGYWGDEAGVDETGIDHSAAIEIARVRATAEWSGLYFGGVAFKGQRPVDPALYAHAAEEARAYVDVITTSGPGTGEAADAHKIEAFRTGAGDQPLAIASGITPENAHGHAAADCFMVATGINRPGDFYRIDPDRLAALMAASRRIGADG